jgi:flagellin
MALTINTNIMSLNAQRNLSTSQTKLSSAIERLSSGNKINSAKDDAAGLAISTRMTTQINGLNRAVSNANDGISLSQTTESALDEVTNNLQRIRELAVQSTNASNSNSDRAALDSEVQQRLSEVTRIATQTNFNGMKVLDGSAQNLSFQVGANVGEVINVGLDQGMKANQVGQLATTSVSPSFSAGITVANGDLTVTNASGTATNVAASTYKSVGDLVTAINTAAGSTVASADATTGELKITNSSTTQDITFGGAVAAKLGLGTVAKETAASAAVPGSGTSTGVAAAITAGGATVANLTVNGTAVAADTYATAQDLADAINTALGGGTAVTVSGGELQISNTGATPITFGGSDATSLGIPASVAAQTPAGTATPTVVTGTAKSALAASTAAVTIADGDLKIQVGTGTAFSVSGSFKSTQDLADAINSKSSEGITAYVGQDGSLKLSSAKDITVTASTAANNGAAALGFTSGTSTVSATKTLADSSVATVDGANDTINRIDAALQSVSDLRSTLGAVQNRFESTISNLQNISQNLTSSKSAITDADFAQETANMSSAQILQQAGVSVLAQANQSQQIVTKLLQ